MRITYDIKTPEQVLAACPLFVHKYTFTHSRLRKLCRRMHLQGFLDREEVHNGWRYRRVGK